MDFSLLRKGKEMDVSDKKYLERNLKVLKATPGLTDIQRSNIIRTEAKKLHQTKLVPNPSDAEIDRFLIRNNMPLR